MKVHLDTGVITNFQKVDFTDKERALYGISTDQKFFIKIELRETPKKLHNLRSEAQIIKYLNDKGSRTCPKLHAVSSCSGAELLRAFSVQLDGKLDVALDQDFPYMVTAACDRFSTIYTPDIAMAIIEQKKLGVWNGDITPGDILVDKKTNCIKIVDYDQAVMLDEHKINMPNLAYFEWLDSHAQERFGRFDQDNFLYNIENVDFETHFLHFFEGNCFNIGMTYLFKSQETTMNKNKIYHSFRTPDVFAQGERTLDDRRQFLDEIEFSKNERVLDIGCNAGLLCHYLQDRGCDVWGIDIDPSVIDGAKILANITNKEGLNFECHDIDNGGPIGHFDTIFLFSVIHHTANIHQNAARIAKFCNRIVIECRQKEHGAKPVGDTWVSTTVWEHENVESLIAGLENLFPGFRHSKTIGQGDRDRYMFEFIKEPT